MRDLVLVTGGSGLVGHSLLDEVLKIRNRLDKDYVFLSSTATDLTDYQATRNLFELYRPKYVVHLAAKVGGLYANLDDDEGLFYRLNTQINENVLKLSYEFKIKICLSCLSTCIFPDYIEYPLDETKIHAGPPHVSNAGYALAKRQVDLLNRRYNELALGRSLFFSIIPTNIYGPHDNFDSRLAHVIPSLIMRTYSICLDGYTNQLVVCGSGKPLRQFLYAPDVAKLILWALKEFKDYTEPCIIISPDESDELSIGELARLISGIFSEELTGPKLQVKFDTSRSDGQFKKTANNAKLRHLNPSFAFTPIEVGLRETICWYCAKYPLVRPTFREPPFDKNKAMEIFNKHSQDGSRHFT